MKVYSKEDKKRIAKLEEDYPDEFIVGLASKSDVPEHAVPKIGDNGSNSKESK